VNVAAEHCCIRTLLPYHKVGSFAIRVTVTVTVTVRVRVRDEVRNNSFLNDENFLVLSAYQQQIKVSMLSPDNAA
jgi:hypothetical protein